MTHTLNEGTGGLTKHAVFALYNSCGWTNYTKDADNLMKAILNSTYVVTCRKGDELLALARCVSDDVSICYLQDILVNPAHQRKGIGRKLLENCLERFAHCRTQVILTDDEERQRLFYESLGFKNTKTLDRVSLNCYVRMSGMKLE